MKTQTNERKKTDIGTGVQMSKYLHHNCTASQGNGVSLIDFASHHCFVCPLASHESVKNTIKYDIAMLIAKLLEIYKRKEKKMK